VVAQGAKNGTGRSQQAVLACGCGELAKTGAQDETTLHVSRHEAVVLEGDGQTMGRRTGKSGGADQLR
jgi:hypothetical protein